MRDVKYLFYLQPLQDYHAAHRALPSFTVIASLLGLKSTGSVAGVVSHLKEMGYLDAGPTGRLIPGARFFERPLAGYIPAGTPTASPDIAESALTIDQRLVRVPSRTVLLNVKGDSMMDAGILDGDVVVVQKGAPTKPGDIVVAIVDNEFTVKYLELDEHGEFYLNPGNKAYAPIRPRDQLEVFGKVTGSFRSYG